MSYEIIDSLEKEKKKKRNIKAIILAGGFGTRLKSVVSDVPKPMAMIAGKPFLEHQIKFLKEQGITDIILAVHHMADKIKSYFGNGRIWHVNITYSEEELPLGTAGAIKKAQKYLDDTFLVLNGDTYSPIDLDKFLEFHEAKKSCFSICLSESKDVSDSGSVILDGNKITNFVEKGKTGEGLINKGIYIFEPKIFDYIESNKNVSLEKEIFPKIADQGVLYGFIDNNYFIDIGKPETYKKFKKDMLEKIKFPETTNVRDIMKNINRNGINLALIVNHKDQLQGVLNDRLIKEYLMNGGNVEDNVTKAMATTPEVGNENDSKEKIEQQLLSGIFHLPIVDNDGVIKEVEFRVEKIKTENYPIIRGKAPLRISFSGGGTDLPHFFEQHGGIVINSTIDKYCYATLVKRADSKILIDSDLTKESDVFVNSINDLKYDGNFDIIKATINLMKPDFGFELYLHNDIPPGRGLGSSASFAVLLVKMLSVLQGETYDDYKIAELANKVETQELGIKGGWQDQYAAVTGGFNFMEFNKDKTIIYPLRLKEEVINELNSRLILCYVGLGHNSNEQHTNQQKTFSQNQDEIIDGLNEAKNIAIEIKNILLTNTLNNLGELLHNNWLIKKKLSPIISNSRIDSIYEIGLKNGALGGRLLGSGGGGYILFYFSPEKRNQLVKALEKQGTLLLNFKFESEGTKVWFVKK